MKIDDFIGPLLTGRTLLKQVCPTQTTICSNCNRNFKHGCNCHKLLLSSLQRAWDRLETCWHSCASQLGIGAYGTVCNTTSNLCNTRIKPESDAKIILGTAGFLSTAKMHISGV